MSRTRASRSRIAASGMGPSYQFGERGHPVFVAPTRQVVEHPFRRTRIGERCSPDLDGIGTGGEQLGGRCRRRRRRRPRRSPHPGTRRGTSNTARTATGCTAWPDRPPPPLPRRARPVTGSRARPITVLTSVTASAPAARTAPAISAMSVTFGLSFAHRGRRHSAVAAIASPARAGSWANMRRRSSTLGQLRLTSTATIAPTSTRPEAGLRRGSPRR